jgi:hypothetical protein
MAAELVHALMLIEARENNRIERANAARTLAVAHRLNCEAVASADKTIAQAPGFSVFTPADILT